MSQSAVLTGSAIVKKRLSVALTDGVGAFVFLKSQIEWNHDSRYGDDYNNKNNEWDRADLVPAFLEFLS